MKRYRVELWFIPDHDGMLADPDRMPDVNTVVRARDAERARDAAYIRANRAACRAIPGRWTDLEIEDSNVFSEDWPLGFAGGFVR